MRLRVLMAVVAVMTLSQGAASADDASIDSAAWDLKTPKSVNWPGVGGQAGEAHFSDLDQVNRQTVARLGLAWSLDLPGEHSLEATPLQVNGKLYFSGQDSTVYAVDGARGTLLWKFDPDRYKYRPRHLRLIFPANRGVAYARGKVFVGTLDGRLIALDAMTGQPVWTVKTVTDDSMQTITGAPRVFKDKVVIGNGGGDAGQRAFVTAYDVETGKQEWRFYIVPGNPADGFEQPAMQMAAKTWSGEWWKIGTGGSAWDSMVYDSELNTLYIGTGNSGPYNPRLRNPSGGDNLFLASIVAVDADTGNYVWHYQENPNEAWDYKATSNIIMANMWIGGLPRKVLLQAPTNGFFYVIDRVTGKLISAEKLGKVTWADRIDLGTGRPVEMQGIRYGKEPITFWPSPYGMHNWQPMAFSPMTGLVYVPTMQLGVRFQSDDEFVRDKPVRTWKAPFASGALLSLVKTKDQSGTGSLVAWDPVAQKRRWSVQYPHLFNGGVLATGGGLVFQGDGEGMVHAFSATNGDEMWRFDAKLGIVGAPVTYSIDKIQYISILVGFGGGVGVASDYVSHGWKYNLQPRRLLTFKLDGAASLPATPSRDFSVKAVDDPSLVIDEGAAVAGAAIYGGGCLMCHGASGKSAGVPGPDLRESQIALNETSFSALLKEGPLQRKGMPQFDDYSDQEIHNLYMYIRACAKEALGRRMGSPATIDRFGGLLRGMDEALGVDRSDPWKRALLAARDHGSALP